jgi:branched-chain amino acid aminotransferase
LIKEINQLCDYSNLNSARIRITCWRKGGGTYRSLENDYDYLIEAFELENTPLSEELITFGFCHDIQKPLIPLSNYKTNASLYFVLAQRYAQKNKWNEVILFNTSGRICEGSYQNIFIVKDAVFCTPPISEGCIDGSSRRFLISLMKQENLPFQEKPLTKSDIETADGLFFSNGMRIISVAKYDGSGQIIRLMKLAKKAIGIG